VTVVNRADLCLPGPPVRSVSIHPRCRAAESACPAPTPRRSEVV
jgi:hypothetical protein